MGERILEGEREREWEGGRGKEGEGRRERDGGRGNGGEGMGERKGGVECVALDVAGVLALALGSCVAKVSLWRGGREGAGEGKGEV